MFRKNKKGAGIIAVLPSRRSDLGELNSSATRNLHKFLLNFVIDNTEMIDEQGIKRDIVNLRFDDWLTQ